LLTNSSLIFSANLEASSLDFSISFKFLLWNVETSLDLLCTLLRSEDSSSEASTYILSSFIKISVFFNGQRNTYLSFFDLTALDLEFLYIPIGTMLLSTKWLNTSSCHSIW